MDVMHRATCSGARRLIPDPAPALFYHESPACFPLLLIRCSSPARVAGPSRLRGPSYLFLVCLHLEKSADRQPHASR